MRIAVKVGTSTLTHESGKLNIRHMEELVKTISDLQNAGHEMMLISSGAIAMGVGRLPVESMPSDIPGKQAAAAVGQCELIQTYDRLFSEYNHVVGQILITKEDFDYEDRFTNLTNTLFRLLKYKVIPIINENDTVETAEIAVGDNDTLSAVVARAAEADLLILLSDIDGLYTEDPRNNPNSRFISQVEEITPEIEGLGGGAGSRRGTGGMRTKLNAAKIAVNSGMDMVIANGRRPGILYDIVAGKRVGTRFIKKDNKPASFEEEI